MDIQVLMFGLVLLIFVVLRIASRMQISSHDLQQAKQDILQSGIQPTSKRATFATGCFRCTESIFLGLPGVVGVQSGWVSERVHDKKKITFTRESDGTYENLALRRRIPLGKSEDFTFTKRQGVQIDFDETRISYADLLDVFREVIDALDGDGQFHERGQEHTTAIYYHTIEQKRLAEISLEKAILTVPYDGMCIETEVLPYGNFELADSAFQGYHLHHPTEWKMHVEHSGRREPLTLG